MRLGDMPVDNDAHNNTVARALMQLGDESRWILHAIYYERITYQELGDRLGVSKPHAWRLAQRAVQQLASALDNNPTIKNRYRMQTTWEEACKDSLDELVNTPFEDTGTLVGDSVLGFQKLLISHFGQHNQHTIPSVGWLARHAWNRLVAEGHEPVVDGVVAVLARKQADYGHGNILAFGQAGILVRLSDKLARIHNLDRRDTDPHNESLFDSLLDIIGYCTISNMLSHDTFTLPLAEDAA